MPVVGERCSTYVSTNMTKEFFFKIFERYLLIYAMVDHFEVNPDIQADFTNMPYEDKSFSMVVFDPPHLLRNAGKSKMADMYRKFERKSIANRLPTN